MTNTQRARKIAAARRRLIEARTLLSDVCDDYAANGYALTPDERDAWRDAVALVSPLERLTIEASS